MILRSELESHKESALSRIEAICGVGGGVAGLERLAEASVDCVITDLGMPGMTGWEVARAIKARAPQLPVLLLTGWADQAETDAASSVVDRILHKPVRLNDLLRAIGDVTQSAGTDERRRRKLSDR